MIPERHNAPQHNHRANRAGDAGDCTSSVDSNLLWRRLGRFFAAAVLVSFVLNEIWEMAQMSRTFLDEHTRFLHAGGGG